MTHTDANSDSLTELFEKRVELAKLVAEAEQRARDFRGALSHVEAAIRILRPDTELPPLVSQRLGRKPRYFKRGELTNLLLDYIRAHRTELITIEAVMPLVVGDRRLSKEERASVSTAVHQALHKIAKSGAIERISNAGRAVRWRPTGRSYATAA